MPRVVERIRDSFLAALGVTIAREVVSPPSDIAVRLALFTFKFALFFLLHPLLERGEQKLSSLIGRGIPWRLAAYEASFIACSITALTFLLLPALAWWLLLGIGLAAFTLFYALLLWLKHGEAT
jgi:hypothetical protein